jgi:hypothetical protein
MIPDVQAGAPLSASEHNANVRAPLRAMQLGAGTGIRITRFPNGTIIHATGVATVGAPVVPTYNVGLDMHGHESDLDGGPLAQRVTVAGGAD